MKKNVSRLMAAVLTVLVLMFSGMTSMQVTATEEDGVSAQEQPAVTETVQPTGEAVQSETGDGEPAGDAAVTDEQTDGQITPNAGADGAAVEGTRRDGYVETVPTHIGDGYVLGARRGQTGELSQPRALIVMGACAVIMAVVVVTGIKKKDDSNK